MDPFTELAREFKNRDNQTVPSITTGIVIKAPPEVEIRLNDIVVLKRDKLIFSAHMLSGYQRNIKFTDTNCGVTTTVDLHNHDIQEVNIDTTMEWTDTIVEGDEVIIMPVLDEQFYVVIDKAVRL